MTSVPTVELLAEAKRLDPDELRGFGLVDAPDGVEFHYVDRAGTAGRTRLRHGLRGAGGSSWRPGDAAIISYQPPAGHPATASRTVLVVEGESDCWAGWHHGFHVVGIPGPENVDALQLAHLGEASELFVQREAEHPLTYPRGVDEYLGRLRARLSAIGYRGPVVTLRHEPGTDDLADLHVADPVGFARQLMRSMERSKEESS